MEFAARAVTAELALDVTTGPVEMGTSFAVQFYIPGSGAMIQVGSRKVVGSIPDEVLFF
jgi:hypothetical protein